MKKFAVNLYKNGKPILVETDGLLNEPPLKAGQEIVLEVTTDDFVGFVVDKNKNVYPKRRNEGTKSAGGIYRRTIKIVRPKSTPGVAAVYYPHNQLRLAGFSSPQNFVIWEISIISQLGVFFLVTEKTFELLFNPSTGEMLWPKNRHWPQMYDFIQRSGLINHLKIVFTDSSFDALPDQEGEGIVLWWNTALGMGAVQCVDGQRSVHWSQIRRKARRAYLNAGEQVKYSSTRQRFSGGFAEELVGVSPL